MATVMVMFMFKYFQVFEIHEDLGTDGRIMILKK